MPFSNAIRLAVFPRTFALSNYSQRDLEAEIKTTSKIFIHPKNILVMVSFLLI